MGQRNPLAAACRVWTSSDHDLQHNQDGSHQQLGNIRQQCNMVGLQQYIRAGCGNSSTTLAGSSIWATNSSEAWLQFGIIG
jgi:hypothetical protein